VGKLEHIGNGKTTFVQPLRAKSLGSGVEFGSADRCRTNGLGVKSEQPVSKSVILILNIPSHYLKFLIRLALDLND
jgi:hypothetical protein